MALRRLASAITLSAGTKTNSASLSTNFLISHGQATRSTLTRSRVIHFIDYLQSLVCIRRAAGDGLRFGLLKQSVFRPMRDRPFPRVLDRSVRRQRRTEASHGRQGLHPLPPSAEGRIFRIHALALGGRSESVSAWQQIEVGERKLRTE